MSISWPTEGVGLLFIMPNGCRVHGEERWTRRRGVASVWLQGQVRVAGVWVMRFHKTKRKREGCRYGAL